MSIAATNPKRPYSISLTAYVIFYLAFLYVPVLFLPLFSFNDATFIAFPLNLENYPTFRWYGEMFANENMHQALWNSIRVGLTASFIATVFGVLGAKAVTRYRIKLIKPVMGIVMLPMVIPVIIIAIALLILLLKLLNMELGLDKVTLGHILFCTPFSIAVMFSRFEGFDRSIEEASLDLGENGWWTFWRVTFPVVFPGILASLLLCFTISFDEFLFAFFLTSTETTLPVFMWSQLRFPARLPSVLALGSMIIVVSFFVVSFSEWLRRRGEGGQVKVEA